MHLIRIPKQEKNAGDALLKKSDWEFFKIVQKREKYLESGCPMNFKVGQITI